MLKLLNVQQAFGLISYSVANTFLMHANRAKYGNRSDCKSSTIVWLTSKQRIQCIWAYEFHVTLSTRGNDLIAIHEANHLGCGLFIRFLCHFHCILHFFRSIFIASFAAPQPPSACPMRRRWGWRAPASRLRRVLQCNACRRTDRRSPRIPRAEDSSAPCG